MDYAVAVPRVIAFQRLKAHQDLRRQNLLTVLLELYPIVTFAVQLTHFVPGFLSYSVAVF